MNAIRIHSFGGPEVMMMEELPTPTPADGQVLIAIKAAGVNPVDSYIRAGTYGPRPFPFTPGFDGAGVVETVGPGVSHVAPGDRVYLDGSLTGTYATHALCEAAQVHPLPPHHSFEQGAGISIPYLTAARALFQKARVTRGETLLVHGGSGGVGLAAIQLAKEEGMMIIATVGSPRGRAAVEAAGAAHVLDHGEAGHYASIMEITAGKGVDVILEMRADVNLGKDLTVLAKNGRVVVIGSRGSVEMTPRDAMSREACIMGMSLFNCPSDDRAALHARLAEGFNNRAFAPVVGKTFALSDAAAAHHAVMAPGALGKIILHP